MNAVTIHLKKLGAAMRARAIVFITPLFDLFQPDAPGHDEQ